MNMPDAMTASPQAGMEDPAARAYFSAKQREQWRRRTLPVLGLFGLVFLWWAVVAGLDVKPFIAPSPQLVVQTMVNKWPVLWQNLIPTAIEAVGGFMLGNFAAILLATVFVQNKAVQEAVIPQSMELMRVLSASKSEVYFKLRLYNSLPYLFSALRIATSTSVIGAVVGEWIGSTRGIGALIIQAT